MTASLSDRTTLVLWIGSSMLASGLSRGGRLPTKGSPEPAARYGSSQAQRSEDNRQSAGDEKADVKPEPEGLTEHVAT